jgi:hypothetical protein
LTARSVRRGPAGLVALVSAAFVWVVVGCGAVDVSPADDAAGPTVEVTEELVACGDAAAAAATDGPIDLGALRLGAVADAERVTVDGGVEIRFPVVVEALPGAAEDESDTVTILQARAQDVDGVLLRVDGDEVAGADRVGAVAALSFARCDDDVRFDVVLTVVGDGCPVLVGNDPVTGGFTELPVRVGVDACAAR